MDRTVKRQKQRKVWALTAACRAQLQTLEESPSEIDVRALMALFGELIAFLETQSE